MADDDRADARDPQVAHWLEVEPLDELTRRRLVTNAVRGRDDAPGRTWRAWRWIAAAAVIVVVLVGGLALLTADSGNDTPTASRQRGEALSPQAFDQALGTAPDVGDFGDLDDVANLAALRAALERSSERKAAGAESAVPASPEAAADATDATDALSQAGSTQFSSGGCLRGATGALVARGTGTIDGRAVTVVLLEDPGGKQSVGALFQDACEFRELSGSD